MQQNNNNHQEEQDCPSCKYAEQIIAEREAAQKTKGEGHCPSGNCR